MDLGWLLRVQELQVLLETRKQEIKAEESKKSRIQAEMSQEMGQLNTMEARQLLQQEMIATCKREIFNSQQEIADLKAKIENRSQYHLLQGQKSQLIDTCKAIGKLCRGERTAMKKFLHTVDEFCDKQGGNLRKCEEEYAKAKVALEPKEEESKIQQLLQELEKAQKDLDAVRADNQALLKSLEESHCTYTSLRRQLDECRAPQHNEDKNTQGMVMMLKHELGQLRSQRTANLNRVDYLCSEKKRIQENLSLAEGKICQASRNLLHLSGADEFDM